MLRLRQDIPLFPKGRKKALTFSYDDGITQDRRFVEMLNRYHLKGTFNLNPGLMGNKDWLSQPGIEVSHYKMDKCEIAELYKGHEIAVHTMTHPDLPRVPEGMIAYEIAACRRELEEIAKKPVTGMAYPFGTYSDKVKNAAKVCGITYSRTTKQHFSFHLPEDFLEWHPSIHHTENTLYPLWEYIMYSIIGAVIDMMFFRRRSKNGKLKEKNRHCGFGHRPGRSSHNLWYGSERKQHRQN